MKINGILSIRNSKITRILIFVAQGCISLLLLFYIGRTIDYELFKQNVGRIDAAYLILALIVMPFAIGMRAYRWHVLLKWRQLNDSFRVAWNITWIGQSLSTFLPSGLGEVLKGYFLPQSQGMWNESIYASIMDKLLGLSAVFFLGIFPCYFLEEKWAALTCLVLWLITFLLPLLLPKVSKHFFPIPISLLMKLFVLGLIGWWLSYLILFILFQPLVGKSVSGFFYFALAPAISIGRLLPISLNGIGVQEWIIVKAMQRLHITADVSFVASLAFTLIMVVVPALIGWIMLLRHWLRARNSK